MFAMAASQGNVTAVVGKCSPPSTKSLRDGLILYDKRKGWRGPLTNIKKLEKWNKEIDKFRLEKSINWDLAVIKKIDKFLIFPNRNEN